MLPSRNPDFPDALVRRPKDLSKGKASARKCAAAAEAGALAGEGGMEAEQDADESGAAAAPVASKKAVKAKPKARKSVVAADPEVEAGLEKTLGEQSAKVSPLSGFYTYLF